MKRNSLEEHLSAERVFSEPEIRELAKALLEILTDLHEQKPPVIHRDIYMPPEQFGGRAVPASDLYGLGATLIALVSRQHPADLPQKDMQI